MRSQQRFLEPEPPLLGREVLGQPRSAQMALDAENHRDASLALAVEVRALWGALRGIYAARCAP